MQKLAKMGSKSRVLFDLNELPCENVDDDNDDVVCFQPRKAIPSSGSATTDLFATSVGSQGIANNYAFTHASSVSGFQPFVRSKTVKESEDLAPQSSENLPCCVVSSSKQSNGEDSKSAPIHQSGALDERALEKEEGECSDAEGSLDVSRRSVCGDGSSGMNDKQEVQKDEKDIMDGKVSDGNMESISLNCDDNKIHDGSNFLGMIPETDLPKVDDAMDAEDDSAPKRRREIKGVEANHALRCANNPGKRQLDQKKESMLGKKRGRQTMFLNLEDVKQASAVKTSTPKRQIPAPTVSRVGKETRSPLPIGERSDKQISSSAEANECKSEINNDHNSGSFRKVATDLSEIQTPVIPRQSSWKQPSDSKQLKNSQFSVRKPPVSHPSSTDAKSATKKMPSRKPNTTSSNPYQDSSVERLLREVTNEKFWQHPDT
ncbi:hypothetical protein M569_07512 [Genlisea aurea]|uniref:Uncharacterized protein n=1 Tax=Genlisea aurea TaxID=192259 RepID=S8CQW1_9LAMI|nr:hypothetical protein M569_07512 [Genlisea aurea]